MRSSGSGMRGELKLSGLGGQLPDPRAAETSEAPRFASRTPRRSTPAPEERSVRAIIAIAARARGGADRDMCALRCPDGLDQGHEQEAGAGQRHSPDHRVALRMSLASERLSFAAR